MTGEACSFCRSQRSLYGCTPGRCLNPRGTFIPAEQGAPSPPPRPAPVKKLGVERVVVAHEFRQGPGGGLHLLLELDCGGGFYRQVGKHPRVPKKALCVFHCDPDIGITCAGLCGWSAVVRVARESWIFARSAWWCPDCATLSLHPRPREDIGAVNT